MKSFYINSKRTFLIIGVFLLLPAISQAATLSVSPSSGTFTIGQSIIITIQLNTQGVAIDGVDVKSLNYNTSLLSIQDDDASTPGVQITPGALLPVSTGNSVQSGKINFSQVSSGSGTTFTNNANQTLATIHAIVLAAGTANLTFDFILNNTTDCNVSNALTHADALTSVTNGSFTLQTDSVLPTVPTSLTATSVSTSQINLAWGSATDNIGVTGYRVSRNGTVIVNLLFSQLNYSDTGLAAGTSYTYTVVALDQAGNVSPAATVTASTQSPPNTLPIGSLDGAITTDIWGWAYDADAGSTALTVHIYVDGIMTQALTANLSRPDLLVNPPGLPDANHGFSWKSFTLAPGTHTIEAFAINVPTGTNPSLGTKSLTILAPTVTISAAPATIILGQSSTLTWSSTNTSGTTPCTASGGWSGSQLASGSQIVTPAVTTTYTLVCTGPGGTASQSTAVTVTPFDFSLSNGGNKTVTQGSVITNNITTALVSGASQGVTFSVSGVPANVATSFSPTSCSPACSSTLTLNAAANAPLGTSTLTVTALGGGVTKTSTFTLTITTGFNFSLSNDGNKNIIQGASALSSITLSLVSGSTQAVTLSAAGLPAGASASFNPVSCSPGCSSTLTITTVATTPVGTSTIIVTGTGGGVTNTTSFTLTITNPVPTVTLTAAPTTITSGQSSTLTWSSANTSGATPCTASGGTFTGAKAASGTQVVSPTTTTTYSLSCTGPGGTTSQSVTLIVNPALLTNVTFSPVLEGRTSITLATPFTMIFYTPGTITQLYSFTANADATGKVALPTGSLLTVGTYDILVSTPNYLKKKLANTALNSNSTVPLPQLTAGDFNNDNGINSLDWSLMNANWFGAGGSTDVNNDGITNSLDFSYLNANWNKVGD